MKTSLRYLLCPLLLSTALSHHASAELLVNGNFTGVVDNSKSGFTYGQFGSDTVANEASGAVLTVPGWDTSGYNFVYTPGVIDQGTTAAGANAGITKEAPGQASVTVNNVKYGNQYMWGTNNGGTNAFGTNPFAGNIIAADGAYETGAITQTVNGLTTGNAYTLTFYWAAAQQESFTTATTEQWKVSLGSQTFSTSVYSLPAKGFSGWMKQTFTYTATAASETLSFLAVGTPSGQPPFLLLGSASLVPEPSSGTLLALVSAGLTGVWFVRRRRSAVDAQA